MTLKTLNYGNYGIFFTMGNVRFRPSTVSACDEGGLVGLWLTTALWLTN